MSEDFSLETRAHNVFSNLFGISGLPETSTHFEEVEYSQLENHVLFLKIQTPLRNHGREQRKKT